ncbi:MAG: hypothetical protein AB8B57_15075 [Congregibacter sp.]
MKSRTLPPERRKSPPRPKTPHVEKSTLREELERATQNFLQGGGEVNEVPTGTSAWEPGTRPPPSSPLFTEPRHERTPVSDVVATIEARKEAMKQRPKAATKTRARRPKRRVIYDDFGEPLRHVWTED